MIVKTDGLIVKTVNYSDSSMIATIYTRELGVKTYMLKGVRNTKGKKGNVIQPMTFLDMVVSNRANKDIQYIKEYKPKLVYKSIPYDVRKSAIGLFMLEVIHMTIQEEEPNYELFDFLEQQFHLLDEAEDHFNQFHLTFILNLCSLLGFQPYDNYDEVTNTVFALQDGFFVPDNDGYLNTLHKGESLLVHEFLASDGTKQLSKLERSMLLDFFEKYLQAHTLNFKSFKTPAIFQMVFG